MKLGFQSDDADVIAAINQTQAIIQFSLDGTILKANTIFLDLMGYQLKEIVGQHHRMFVDPAYGKSQEYAAFWESLRQGMAQTAEFCRFTKQGRPVWIQASYIPIRRNGKVQRIIKFATNITEQVMLNSSNQAQINALHRAQAVIEFELDGTILTANDNFLNLMGYRLDEIQGQHHRLFVAEDEANSDAYQNFWQQLRNGEYQTAEFRRITKTGREVWIYATYNPVRGPDGHLVKVIKFANDITRNVEQRSEFELLSLVANETDNAVLISASDRSIKYVNNGFARMTGYNLEQARGRRASSFLYGPRTDEATQERIDREMNQPRAFYDEIEIYQCDQTPIWVSVTSNPVYNHNNQHTGYIAILANITEVKSKALEFETRFNAISAANLMIEWDSAGRVLAVNE